MKKLFSPVPESFGFDISDLSIKIVELNAVGKNIKIGAHGKKNIPMGIIEKGVIKDEPTFIQLVREAVEEIGGSRLKKKWVVASVPEREAFLRIVQLPQMSQVDIKHAIKWGAEQNIPLDLEDAYYDWQMINTPFQKNLDHIDVLVVASPKQTINSYLRALEMAGLNILSMEIEPIAISRAIIGKENINETILIVDVGAMKTGISIYSGGTLRFTASINVSGHMMSEALSKGLSISYSEAERIKIEFGFSREAQEGKIFELLKPAVDSLIKQLLDYVYYYEDYDFHEHMNNEEKKITKILFCGGSVNLKNIAEYCSKKTKINVELANPWINVLAPPLKEIPDIPYEKSLGYATAIGLALKNVTPTNP